MAIYKDSFHIPDVSDGEDTLSLVVTPHAFTFQTDDKGEVGIQTSNTGKVKMYLGTTEVRSSKIEITQCKNCIADVSEAGTLTIHSITKGQWSGFVTISATYNGQVRTAKIEFIVSAQKYNEAQFETTSGQFKSIQKQFERVDGEITDTKSTINQLPEKITLEVLRHENGINMLKGASLRYPDMMIFYRVQYVKIGNSSSIAHNSHNYISIERSNAPQKEWNGCKFKPFAIADNKKYTLSFYYKTHGNEESYIEIAMSRNADMSDSKAIYKIFSNTFGSWKPYTHTFDVPSGYKYVYIFFGLFQNGKAYFSEIQLEEGNKATPWTNPDKDERFRRAGIDLDLERIVLQANKVYIKNSKGEQTAAIDQDGNLIAGTLRTKDNGGGYIYMHDNLQEYYKHGANHPSRRIGYIGNDWVDQRLSDDGNVIWEMNERGIVHYQTPERWVLVSDAYITTIEDIKKFFLINQGRTLYLIFNSSNHKSATLKEYVAARDVNGNIISSAGVTVETGQANDGKLFYTSQNNGGLSLGGRFNLDDDKFSSPFTGLILATKPMHYYPFNNQSGQIAIPPEYTKFRQLYGVEDYYYVDFNRPVEWAYINIYHLGRRMGSHRMFRNK